MNNFIRIVLGIMFLSCGREASFTVTGDVEGLDDVMVYFELGAASDGQRESCWRAF